MVRKPKTRKSVKRSSTLKNPLFRNFIILAIILIGAGIAYYLTQGRTSLFQRASYDPTTRTFTETFDGAPTTPQPFIPLSDWDIQVHSRESIFWDKTEPMEAHHGSDCSAPIDVTGNLVTHHIDGTYEQAVFKCRDHIMTALNASAYGAIYLTPNAMMDWSSGESVLSFDVSTLMTSTRDWWDIRISPFNENLALPLDSTLPDLTGEPMNMIAMNLHKELSVCPDILVNGTWVFGSMFTSGCDWGNGYTSVLTPSPKDRTTFEIRISPTHIKVWLPKYNLVWFDKDVPRIPFTQGVVQFGHHSYTPLKACDWDGTCFPDTWHWDNISISPSTPFYIKRATPWRQIVKWNTPVNIDLPEPAPAGAYLRFGASSDGWMINDGSGWKKAQKNPSTKPDSWAVNSYMTPIPQGTRSVQLMAPLPQGWPNDALLEGIHVWSLNNSSTSNPTPTSGATLPTPTPTIVIAPTTQPTSTPLPTMTPLPTNTPTPIPTRTPTPLPTTSVPTPTIPPTTGVQGINGSYYSDMNLTNLAFTRVDSNINFNWGYGSPDPRIGSDRFSVRWKGIINVPTTDNYTFYTRSDDGVRLWIDGNLIVNNWTNHSLTENSGRISLSAGRHTIQMEYYENGGRSRINLLWRNSVMTKQVIASSYFVTE